MCKVSVLIPAYNVELYLRECLDSVRNQTMTDWEMIVVDDASTDGTLAILREYEAADARIHVYCHEQNRGQACGRNLALSHASGEYVYMLDADDKILPEAFEELYRQCVEDRLDAVGFENRQFTESAVFAQAAAGKTIDYKEGPVMDGGRALIYCMENEVFSLSVPTFMMKRSYLEAIQLQFTEGILHEDVGYLFELITRAGRIRFLPKVYFLRRIREKSTMTTAFTAANIEGYLKSFFRSFELEPCLEELYGGDVLFRQAVKKWQRDIFGRIRQLYLQSEETIYAQKGGHVDEEIRRMLEILKLMASGKARAEDILGKEMCDSLLSLASGKPGEPPQVYICGMGQYAERTIDLVGALGIVIRGILVREKHQKAFRGFPVYSIADCPVAGYPMADDPTADYLTVDCSTADYPIIGKKAIPVILGVSHYQREEYERALKQAGWEKVIHVRF